MFSWRKFKFQPFTKSKIQCGSGFDVSVFASWLIVKIGENLPGIRYIVGKIILNSPSSSEFIHQSLAIFNTNPLSRVPIADTLYLIETVVSFDRCESNKIFGIGRGISYILIITSLIKSNIENLIII